MMYTTTTKLTILMSRTPPAIISEIRKR